MNGFEMWLVFGCPMSPIGTSISIVHCIRTWIARQVQRWCDALILNLFAACPRYFSALKLRDVIVRYRRRQERLLFDSLSQVLSNLEVARWREDTAMQAMLSEHRDLILKALRDVQAFTTCAIDDIDALLSPQ